MENEAVRINIMLSKFAGIFIAQHLILCIERQGQSFSTNGGNAGEEDPAKVLES